MDIDAVLHHSERRSVKFSKVSSTDTAKKMRTPFSEIVIHLQQKPELFEKLSHLLSLRDENGLYIFAHSTTRRIVDVTPTVLELLESLLFKFKREPIRSMNRLSLWTIRLLHNMLANWNPACVVPDMSVRFARVRRALLAIIEGYRRDGSPVIPGRSVVNMNPVWIPNVGSNNRPPGAVS